MSVLPRRLPVYPMPRLAVFVLLVCSLPLGAAARPPGPVAAGFPSPFEVAFDVNTRGMTVAETHWSLRRAGDGAFVYESRSHTRGMVSLVHDESVVERSEVQFVDGRLQPLAYSYDRNRGEHHRQVSVSFDWARGKAANSVADHTWAMPVPAGTLDKLSYVLAMIHDLREGKRHLSYPVADGGTLKTYVFDVTGEARVETVLGTFSVLKVHRRRRTEKRETVFWCAQALGYFPVRITHRESDGALYQLDISRAEGI